MRALFALPVLVLIACQGPPPIQTSASGPLRSEVEQDVLEAQRLHHPDCPAARIVAARILQQGTDATQELWTLEGCGHAYTYDVTVSHEGFGGQVSVHEHEEAAP